MGLLDLGFTPTQERVYRTLIENPLADVVELMRLCDLDRTAVNSATNALCDLGVLRPGAEPGQFKVPNPAVALGMLVERREDETLARYRRIAETRSEIAELEVRHGRTTVSDDPAGIERLDGVAAVRARLEELSFYHRHSAYSIQPGGPQDKPTLDASRPLNLRTLRRNLKLKAIYEASTLDDDLNRAYLRELVTHGAQIRLAKTRPDRMLIIDEEVAVVPIDPRNTARGAIVVRQPALVAGFLDLFNRVWDEAADVPWNNEASASPPAFTVDNDDIKLLALLASGCTDETAAREVGLSVRHLRRKIARLMTELGAKSRFEAGVEAARRGWI